MAEPSKNPLIGLMVGDGKPEDGGSDKHDCAQDILDAIKADNPAKLSAALDDYQAISGPDSHEEATEPDEDEE